MASMVPAISSSPKLLRQLPSRRYTLPCSVCNSPGTVLRSGTFSFEKLKYPGQQRTKSREILMPIFAASAGLETSVADSLDDLINFKNVEIAVESQDADKMQLRVVMNEVETQKAFDIVLRNLARSAPPIHGFRREKGGKTSKVPTSILLDMLGQDRVLKFVMREIVTSTMSNYAKKENLSVKENKVSTVQTEDELKTLFSPGKAFGFSAVLELENEMAEIQALTSTSD